MTLSSRGHEEAFAELYDRTSQRIYGIILRVLRSPDHAAEVMQEVYVEVWRQSARYSREKGSVIAWMTTMAHRRGGGRGGWGVPGKGPGGGGCFFRGGAGGGSGG